MINEVHSPGYAFISFTGPEHGFAFGRLPRSVQGSLLVLLGRGKNGYDPVNGLTTTMQNGTNNPLNWTLNLSNGT